MDDWDSVTVIRKKAPTAKDARNESTLNQARRAGAIVATDKKCMSQVVRCHVPCAITVVPPAHSLTDAPTLLFYHLNSLRRCESQPRHGLERSEAGPRDRGIGAQDGRHGCGQGCVSEWL